MMIFRYFLKNLILFIALWLGSNLFAQNSDAKAEQLISELKQYNLSNQEVMGFRVQIYNDLSEGQARSAENKFKGLFSDISTYLIYQQPDWKVQVGNFDNEIDAIRLLNKVRLEFPGAMKLKTTISN